MLNWNLATGSDVDAKIVANPGLLHEQVRLVHHLMFKFVDSCNVHSVDFIFPTCAVLIISFN